MPTLPKHSKSNNIYNNIACLTLPTTNIIDKTQQAVLNSSCLTHTLKNDALSEERQATPETKIFGTPTGAMTSANNEALLPFLEIPKKARQAHHYLNLR